MEAFATSAAISVATARSAASELQRQRLAAAEGERGRWARELHDETLQSLAGLRLSLSMARRKGGLKVLEEAVAEAIEHLEDGISNLRALVTDLRPAALDQLGLAAALAALCERASRHGLQIDSSIELAFEQGREPTRHTPELESAIYRIIQEALTNATKHGHATRAVIETRENASTVELSVRDDGDGFDPATSTAGFGLLGMRERVATAPRNSPDRILPRQRHHRHSELPRTTAPRYCRDGPTSSRPPNPFGCGGLRESVCVRGDGGG